MSSNKKESSNNALMMTLLKGRTFIVLIVLLIFFSITANNFLSVNTLLLIGKHVALYGIIAIGMTYVIITGGIDLSVGSILTLVSSFGVVVFNATNSILLTLLFTLAAGAVCGLVNGLLIGRAKMPAFIVTLGTMLIYRSIAQYSAPSTPILPMT